MRNLRHLGAAIFLTCALSLSAFAGEVHTPGKDGQMETPLAGEMGTPGIAGQMDMPLAGEMDCPLAMLLDILRSALS